MGGNPEQPDNAPLDAPEKPEQKEVDPPKAEKGVPIDEAPKEKEADEKKETPEGEKEEGTEKPKMTSKAAQEALQLQTEAQNMSNEELMGKFFELFGNIVQTLSSGKLGEMFGNLGPKFSPEQVNDIKVDLAAAEQKEYDVDSQNKAVEFVCAALNLPVKPTVSALLYSLQNTPQVVYEKDKTKINEAKVGDVLFFRKEGADPHLTAIISEVGPPMMMKYVNEKGEIEHEEVQKSPHFEQEWFGVIRLPEKQKPPETPST